MKIIKHFKTVLFFLVFAMGGFGIWQNDFEIGVRNLKHDLNDSYKAVVYSKIKHRGNNIILQKYHGKRILSTDELYNGVEIGDTIIKIINSNICVVFKQDTSIAVYNCLRIIDREKFKLKEDKYEFDEL